jgi:FkbM family methyltransferase
MNIPPRSEQLKSGAADSSNARSSRLLGVKPRVQRALRSVGLLERVRASRLCDLYWSLSNSSVIANRRREVSFYRHLLHGFQQGDLIFDIGANDGSKTDVFLRLGARVVAVEPDELNVETIRRKFQMLRLRRKPLTIVDNAVSDSCGRLAMWINAPGSAQNTLSDKWVSILRNDQERFGERFEFTSRREVTTVTLDRLMSIHGVPYFIKVDVEGFEPTVLRGLRHAVPFLQFEINLPEFRGEGVDCIKLLQGVEPAGRFNVAADCLGGLALERWVDVSEILAVIHSCNEPSIDVFWRTP